MGDPLSAISGVLAIAGFAAQTCECLYKHIKCFSGADGDLKDHLGTIASLQVVFSSIAKLEEDYPNLACHFSPDFGSRLQSCLAELNDIEASLQSYKASFEQGRARRTWARARWSAVDSRQRIEKHLSRVNQYYKTFSLDLALLNLQLTLSHHAGGTPGSTDLIAQQILEAADVTKCSDNSESGRSNPKTCHEQLHVRSWLSRYYEGACFALSLWFGPGGVLSQHGIQGSSNGDQGGASGYGAAIAFSSRRVLSLRFELMILWSYQWYESQLNSSLRWSISLPPVIDYKKPILDMLIAGNVDGMKEEFSMKKATPFDTCIDGTTLLHVAVAHDQAEAVQLLLQEGAKVNAMTDIGNTPLRLSLCLLKRTAMSRLLIHNDADLHCLNAYSQTPFHSFPSQYSIELMLSVDELLDYSAPDYQGMTIMHYLAWSSHTPLETFRRCHHHSRLPVTAVGQRGRTMLHLAAARGNVPIVKYLLETGSADIVTIRDDFGETALHSAVDSKRASLVIQELIMHGADLWATNNNNKLAHHSAATRKNASALRTLLDLSIAKEGSSIGNSLDEFLANPEADYGKTGKASSDPENTNNMDREDTILQTQKAYFRHHMPFVQLENFRRHITLAFTTLIAVSIYFFTSVIL